MILKIIFYGYIDIIIDKVTILTIPILLFVFLICDKLSNQIKIFNVKKFFENNNIDEIKNMMFNITDNLYIINQKYYVTDIDDIYLDIPLLLDFFLYNMKLIPSFYYEKEITFKLNIHESNFINQYVDKIVLMFEEIIYIEDNFNKLLHKHHKFINHLITMKCNIEYLKNCSDNY